MQLAEAAAQIVEAGRWLDLRNWMPATSGNCSVRLNGARIAITASGTPKGRLTVQDVMVVDSDGRCDDARRPSAETALHTLVYRLDSTIGAVVHTHSVGATVLGLLLENERALRLTGYELLKALPGVPDHAIEVIVPIVENDQDMLVLSAAVAGRWHDARCFGYLIRGHGLHTWGRTMNEALRCVEAFEFLFACELELQRRRSS